MTYTRVINDGQSEEITDLLAEKEMKRLDERVKRASATVTGTVAEGRRYALERNGNTFIYTKR